MKKKIGIITFHRAHNYGASLQCLALIKTINNLEMDYDVQVVDYLNPKIENDYSLFRIDKTNIKTILKSLISSIVFIFQNSKRRKIYKKYIRMTFPLTRKVYNREDSIFEEFDVIITGSDQVWNPSLTGGIDDIYFLNINSGCRKISYAASLGSNMMNKDRDIYKTLLSNIDSISIREKNGCEIVSNLLNSSIKNVLDPTLLLDKNDWKQYLKNENLYSEKYIFVYSPNNLPEFADAVNYISNFTKFGIVNFAKKNWGFNNVLKNLYCSDPNDFLNYINQSELVVVTSFHAVIFSIIFHKNFWVISPKDNNSRVNTLLGLLGLENRMFNSIEELKELDLLSMIDYTSVDNKLEQLKQDSLKWLKEELEKDNE